MIGELRQLPGRLVLMRASECALCAADGVQRRFFATRYGFRMHMDRVHGYASRGHARPGSGQGRKKPLGADPRPGYGRKRA